MNLRKQPKLFFIGVGPGDPELLTLKAVRLIKSCDVLFVPVRKKDSTRSIALNIVNQAMDLKDKRVVYLHFPMVKGSEKMLSALSPAALTLQEELSEGETGVFITLGCSTIYSTGGNLFLALQDKDIAMHFVPGVSSISGTAASSGMPLVFSEEKLAILPTTYSMDQIESCINNFETVVLMKAHSCMDAIMKLIKQKGLLDTSFMVEKATSEAEVIHCLRDMPDGYQPHYMSTIIIRN
ncbi:MAG: precorrin-2 C(20)-methyltransferase [Proteobacteria bacterium]|nr:precorrin-2 C(20)-methyltransferase [Pseudomonadota bacterium]